MAEWPKTWYLERMGDSVEVIPADLGRELYEALKREAKLGMFGRSDIARKALARYEKEVGE